MHLDPLGELAPDREFPDWLVSAPVPVPILGGVPLAFTLEGVAADSRPGEFTEAVRNFLALRLEDRDSAAPHILENYQRIAADWGLAPGVPQLTFPADVWACVHPVEIRVSRRRRCDQRVYVQVCAECDWEPEHGLQLVYREGRQLSRVSQQDGHLTHTDAFDLPEEEDRIE